MILNFVVTTVNFQGRMCNLEPGRTMRWKSGRRSTNIEDRRGSSGGVPRRGRGMKLGGGAAAILLLPALLPALLLGIRDNLRCSGAGQERNKGLFWVEYDSLRACPTGPAGQIPACVPFRVTTRPAFSHLISRFLA